MTIGEKTPAARDLRQSLHDELEVWVPVSQVGDKLYVFLELASHLYKLPERFEGLTVVPRVRGGIH